MQIQTVGVVFGGRSSEYTVSLQSAAAVLRHINREVYVPVMIGISQEGDWFHFQGEVDEIENDTWQEGACVPAVLSTSPSVRGLVVMEPAGAKTIPLDILFPVLHGKNGEDGSVQGIAQLAGIPLAGSGCLASAVCMDKHLAHLVANAAGVAVPEALAVAKDEGAEALTAAAQKLGYPLFVKPTQGGSSIGISLVDTPQQLEAAAAKAYRYHPTLLLERPVPGFEVGCSVMGNDTLVAGCVDEIELSGGYFDFEEKYSLHTSKIHMPARISPETKERVRETARTLYRALGCRGFARVDMFLTPEGDIVFNEINTIPGFTAHSRFPAMLGGIGMQFEDTLDLALRLAVQP